FAALAYVVAHARPLTHRERWMAPAIFWTAVAAGVLLKGPVIVLVVGLCVATLSWRERSIRWLGHLRPMLGLLWCSALVLPWLLAIYAQSGAAFVSEFARDFVPGFVRGLKSHAAPPGYFVLVFWLTFWPGSTFVGLAIPAVVRDRRVPGTSFLLAWTVPTWIVCELLVNKLPQYVLPLYPAIAILVAQAVTTRELSNRQWLRRGTIWGVLVPLIVGALAIGGSFAFGRSPSPIAWVLIIGAVAISIGSWRELRRDRPEAALVASVVAALCLSAGIYGTVLPHLRPLFPAATLAEIMARSGCAHPTAVTSLGYQEPSVVFLTGTETRATSVTGAIAFLGGGACRFAFVDAKDAAAFAAEAAQTQLPYVEVTRVDGLNFTKGVAVALVVYQSSPR
ncbi:MAG: glycosyl transferase, partial [Acidobacteria bacterium]|nr:glycosyl transferase [Acidobacteriota bacterium]